MGSTARVGAWWQTASQVIEVVLGIAVLIYLAHLVQPSIFGVVSLAIALTIVVTTTVSTPIVTGLVALRFESQRSLSTAWSATCISSSAFSLAIIGALAAVGFRNTEFIAVTVVAASMPILACSMVVQAILQQRLDFRAMAIGRAVAALTSCAVAVSLGASGFGLAALLSRSVTGPLVITAVGLLQARWRPSLIIDRSAWRTLALYARGVAGFGLLNQLNRHSDNLFVGAFLGPTALGYYSMAYRFISVPVGQVSSVAVSVVFPTVVRIDDPRRFRDALLRSQKVLVWIVAPVAICSMALGDVVVPTVLGEQWVPAGPIVQVFGAIALVQVANTQAGVIYLARDATGLLMRWAMIATPVFVASFALGLLGGTIGVAWAYLAANLILSYHCWQIPGGLVGLGFAMVLRSLRVELGLAVALVGATFAARVAVTIDTAMMATVSIVVLSSLYWILALLIDIDLRSDVRELLAARRIRTPPPADA